MRSGQNSKSRLKRQSFDKPKGISSLRRCGGTREEEELKERIADEMLKSAPQDQARPAYSESRMARHVQGRCVVRIDSISEAVVSQMPSQSALDELKFLMKVTPLTPRERFLLRAWMLGWTQQETAARWMDQLGPEGRFNVCRALKGALEKCRENSKISLDAMCRHEIYHRPVKRNNTGRSAICFYCKEPYLITFGDGHYCSAGCRFAAASGG